MGLWIEVITDHGPHLKFSYGGFGQFRRAIAEMAGFLLKWKRGFGGSQEWIGDEPFYYLLDHSDSDGTICEEDCKDLLKDFKKYREEFEVECADKGYPDWMLSKYDEFTSLLEMAIDLDGRLLFG